MTATSGNTQIQAETMLGLAEEIIRRLGDDDAFSTELDSGLTIEEARNAMALDPAAWLLANRWIQEN